MSREPQRISRLTPLADVLALVSRRVNPAEARQCEVRAAHGYVLAQDIRAAAPCPDQPLALRDGVALASVQTLDASAYAPAPLDDAREVETGMALPGQCDAVAPYHATQKRGDRWEALSPIAQDDGVLASEADMRGGEVLRRAGHAMRAIDVAVCIAAGIAVVSVRAPRVLIVAARATSDDRIIDAIVTLLQHAVMQEGCVVAPSRPGDLAAQLVRTDTDAILVVGGTGEGAQDRSAILLVQAGELTVHGIALSPCETAGVGFVGHHPVMLIPGRLDAALAAWLLLAKPILTTLTARTEKDAVAPMTLSRKTSSPVGLAGIVAVRHDGDGVQPLASAALPWATLAQADGFATVAAESEGFVAGAMTPVRPLP